MNRLLALAYLSLLLAAVNVISICIDIVQGEWFAALFGHDHFVAIGFFLMVAHHAFDKNYLIQHQEVRRTWRRGRLVFEHRTDHDGNRTSTHYGAVQ
jgi:hypothetical protein